MSIRKLTTSSITNNRWYKSMLAENDYPGKLDLNFNRNDTFTAVNNTISAIAFQSDGKILLAGSFDRFNNRSINRLVRLNADYTFDPTFVIGTGPNSAINTIAIQSDGKIVIGGSFTSYNGTTRNRIARLNSDGSLDATFDTSSGFNNTVSSIAVDSNNKIVVGGTFTTYKSITKTSLIRLNSDASIDISFNNNIDGFAGNNRFIDAIDISSTGKIAMNFGGSGSATYNGTLIGYGFLVLNSDGTLDTTFNTGTGFSGSTPTPSALKFQSDGKVVVGGQFNTYNGTSIGTLVRLNTNGTLDSTFANNSVTNTSDMRIGILSNGKIIAAGRFSSYAGSSVNNIVLINSDGTRDTSFPTGRTGSDSNTAFVTNSLAVGPGNIIAFSSNGTLYNNNPINRLAIFNEAGQILAGAIYGYNSWAATTVIQPDLKIVLAGWGNGYNGSAINNWSIIRINPDGSRDNTFNNLQLGSAVYCGAIQSDNKIVLGGGFSSPSNRIIRLNTNGTIDTSFTASSGGGSVSKIFILPDGKMLVGGSFLTFNSATHRRLIKLNADGTTDTSFSTGSGFDDFNTTTSIFVDDIGIQSDGKIIVVGNFVNYNGNSRNRIVRLNSDGSLDTTFNIGTGANNGIINCLVLPDNKIVIGGSFTSYNGTTRNRIARLNSDGSLDTAFIPPSLSNQTNSLVYQNDGKVFFTTGQTDLRRLNTDGSLDSSFIPIGINGSGYPLYANAHGNSGVIINGFFEAVNGIVRNSIARVLI